MFLCWALLTSLTAASTSDSLLSAVPENAWTLVHCPNVAALRTRAEANDWYRLLGSPQGESIWEELEREFRHSTHSDLDGVLPVAEALTGEAVFFDTGSVAGFVAEAPGSPQDLTGRMRGWLPEGDAARRTFTLGAAVVEMVAWPDEQEGWRGRAGHFAAFVEHPDALAIFSGDDAASLTAVLNASVGGLGTERRVPLVSAYLDDGGAAGGIGVFVDFTPLIAPTEEALREALDGVLPDPRGLLGLEEGVWLHAETDFFPGTRVQGSARLHLPEDTLIARLADTWTPLPRTLPAELPNGIWALNAWNWDMKRFYRLAREAYEEAGRGEGLAPVDEGLQAAEGLSGVDPIVDVLDQLSGVFAFYAVEPPEDDGRSELDAMDFLASMGLYFGVLDGDAFLTVFETLFDSGGLQSVFDLEDIAGVDAYVISQSSDGIDGGLAFLPNAFVVGPARRVLERAVQALMGVPEASLAAGSRMQAVVDENAGACAFSCVELTPLRRYVLPESNPGSSPPVDGQPARDPFDAQLISSARRTARGFEFRLETR